MAAAKKADEQAMVKIKVKKAESISDGDGGFFDEGAEIEVPAETAESLKDKGLI